MQDEWQLSHRRLWNPHVCKLCSTWLWRWAPIPVWSSSLIALWVICAASYCYGIYGIPKSSRSQNLGDFKPENTYWLIYSFFINKKFSWVQLMKNWGKNTSVAFIIFFSVIIHYYYTIITAIATLVILIMVPYYIKFSIKIVILVFTKC